LQADPGDQLPHCVRRKLGTVVWANLARRLAIGEHNGQIAARHHQMPSVAMVLPLDVLVIVRAPFDAYSPSRWVTLWSTAGPSHLGDVEGLAALSVGFPALATEVRRC
jgi:hypothetical protein